MEVLHLSHRERSDRVSDPGEGYALSMIHRPSPDFLTQIDLSPPGRGESESSDSDHALIIDPQSDAAVDGVADRLRAQRAVDEEVGDPALGDAEAEPAAIFEPGLIADGRHHEAVAGDGGDDTGMVRKRLHQGAVDVALDARAEQMRPLSAELDQIGAVGAGRDRGAERIERGHRVRIAIDALPQLPEFD